MKRWGYVITGILGGMLVAMVLRDSTPSQIGGGDVCLCATQVVITATPQMVISPTPLATPTDGSVQPSATVTPLVRNTPTIVPPGMTHTPDITECPGYPMAATRKGFDYVYLDRNRTGWHQRIRSCPSTDCGIVGYLAPNVRRQTFYSADGWESLNSLCSMWVFNPLGALLER